MTTKTDFAEAIVAALQERGAVKTTPDDNPLASRSIEDLIGGVRKGADNYPAQRNFTEAAIAMDSAASAGLKVGAIERASKRKKAARARKQRSEQIEAAVNASVSQDKPMSPERIEDAWQVIAVLYPIIEAISRSKRNWVQRYLGDLTADCVGMTIERMVNVLAGSNMDLSVLLESAEAIISKAPAPVLPEDASDEDRKHRKAVSKGCSWVMGVVNNCVLQSIETAYNSDENRRWSNFDTIFTVMNSANNIEDAYVARFRADHAPKMSGWRWAQPGEFDPALLSVALDAAITDRHLDPLVELFIGEGNTHPGGTFRWEALASQVFLLGPDGEWLWDAVERESRNHKHPEKAQAIRAKAYVAQLFGWMPGFIVDVCHALPDLPFGDGKRYPLAPALSYATAQDAAKAIMEVLA